jgi:hypothetical protein
MKLQHHNLTVKTQSRQGTKIKETKNKRLGENLDTLTAKTSTQRTADPGTPLPAGSASKGSDVQLVLRVSRIRVAPFARFVPFVARSFS